MKLIVSYLAGLIFSAGLVISGMINPEKVLNFLDLLGTWDPSLAFVMGGAVLITFVGYRVVLKRPSPIFTDEFSVPSSTEVDRRLLGGAILFGIGWGLVGICPGPAIAGFGAAPMKLFAFISAMVVGMVLFRAFSKNAAKAMH